MYSSFILTSQELETAQVSTNGRMDNLAVMQLFLSNKKQLLIHATTRMNLKNVLSKEPRHKQVYKV